MIIGVISSGDCLAVAPVAEELKKFTVLFDCATYRIFEEASYKYVFRTTTMATQENVAAVRYVVGELPQPQDLLGHQSELRLGPGRLVRLHRVA